MSTIVPRLTTERLVLRGFARGDFDAFAADLAVRDVPPGPVDRRTAWRMFLSCSGTWLIHGIGWWGVELAATKELVGTCGAFHREPHPDRETPAEDLELGWTIFAPFRKQGYATEAARAVLDFVRRETKEPRIIALIDHENSASIRVAENIGLRYERDIDFYQEVRLRLYALSRTA